MADTDIIIPEVIETKNGSQLPSLQAIEKEYSKKMQDLKKK